MAIPNKYRRQIATSVDNEVIEVVNEVAGEMSISRSRFIEFAIIHYLGSLGSLPESYRPLPETRGHYQRAT